MHRQHTVHRPSRRRGVLALAGIAATALTLTACAPGGSSTSGASSQPVSTTVAGKTTITLLEGAGSTAFATKLIAGFEKANPNITVKLHTEPDADFTTVEPKLLNSADAPDVVGWPAGAINFIKDGQFLNLDDYATAYGWDKLPAAQLEPFRSDGTVIGKGSLYAFSAPAGPVVGVFYNKKLAKQLGITSAPADQAAFTADLAKAKAAGITPIVTANKIGLLAHLWNIMIGNYGGPETNLKATYNDPSADLDTSQTVAATTQISTWLKAGYFNSDINALDQDPSYAQFIANKALFTIQGSWVLTPLAPMVKADNLGFFPLPPVTAGGQQTSMSSPSLAFSIPTKSKNHNAAATFLNWTQTPEAAAAAYDTGYSALKPNASTTVGWDDSITDQLSSAYASISKQGGITNWVQNANNTMNTQVTTDMQKLAGNQIAPAAMVADLQSTYKESIK